MVWPAIDIEQQERFSPLGDRPFELLDLSLPTSAERASMLSATSAVVMGYDMAGSCPTHNPGDFDILLTVRIGAEAPWVAVPSCQMEERCAAIAAIVRHAPLASASLRSVLRVGERLDVESALDVESFAYSMLLGGSEFTRWRGATGDVPAIFPPPRHVDVSREDDIVTVTLANPGQRNTIDAPMRDALFEALAAVVEDPTLPELSLRAEGRCFSTGGDLAEFGTAKDLAFAHQIRRVRSCAGLLLRLQDRATVHLHGACVGSGIEIPAAAGRRIARANTFFQLPELKMGLIPGAGGTVTISRLIGRHRTAYMAFSGRRITVREALSWGLVTAMEE